MDKLDQAKKILSKAQILEQGKSIAYAKEFIDINDKVDSVVEKADKIAKEVDTKLSEISSELKKKLEEELSYEIDPETIRGEKGKDGEDGKDYVLTEKDKKDIAKSIKVPIVEKIIEKTEVIKEQPIITNEIKEVAVADTGEQIVDKINELPTNEDDKKIDFSHIKNAPQFKNGNYYGGSGIKEIIAGGSNVHIDNNNPGYPVLTVDGDGIGDMLKATYDPANGASQVAFATDLANYLKLNQTTPQTVDSGRPIFNYGINLPATTSATTGVIMKGTSSFIHNFQSLTGSTATPDGKNTFMGVGSGNFTMGSTATSVNHGSYNSFFGWGNGPAVTTGGLNSIFGSNNATRLTTGGYNSFFGVSIATNATSATFNTGMGVSSLSALTTGSQNVSVSGINGLARVTTGSYNTSVGTWAGYGITTADYGTFIGYSAGRYETASNKIIIDNLDRTTEALGRSSALFYGITNSTLSSQILNLGGGGKVGIGMPDNTPTHKLTVYGTTATDSIRSYVGFDIYPVSKPTAPTLALINSAGNIDSGVHYYQVSYTTSLGESVGGTVSASITTDATHGQVTVTIPVSTDPRVTGRKIYRTKAGGGLTANYLLATIADNTSTTYIDNIADSALTGSAYAGEFHRDTTSKWLSYNGTSILSIDSNNLLLGLVGANLTSGGRNVIVGTNQTGQSMTTGIANNLFGHTTGISLTSGGSNNLFGYGAGYFITTNFENSAFGHDALFYGNNSQSTSVGAFSLFGTSSQNNNNSTAFGYYAGGTSYGSYNNYIGYEAGGSGTANVNRNNSNFIGYYAGRYETGSAKLIIDMINRTTEARGRSEALIYGVANAIPANQILSIGGGGKVGVNKIPTASLDAGLTFNSTLVNSPIAFNVSREGADGFLTASSGIQYFSQISPSINQSGTAGWVGLRIMAGISASGSGEQTLLQLGDNTNHTKFEADGSRYMVGTAHDMYGSMYNDGSKFSVTCTDVETYYELQSNFTDGGSASDAFTFVDEYRLQAIKAGKYKVVWSMTVGKLEDTLIQGKVMINEVAQANTVGGATNASTTSYTTISGTGIIELEVNDYVSLSVADFTNSGTTPEIRNATLTIIQVGGN